MPDRGFLNEILIFIFTFDFLISAKFEITFGFSFHNFPLLFESPEYKTRIL